MDFLVKLWLHSYEFLAFKRRKYRFMPCLLQHITHQLQDPVTHPAFQTSLTGATVILLFSADLELARSLLIETSSMNLISLLRSSLRRGARGAFPHVSTLRNNSPSVLPSSHDEQPKLPYCVGHLSARWHTVSCLPIIHLGKLGKIPQWEHIRRALFFFKVFITSLHIRWCNASRSLWKSCLWNQDYVMSSRQVCTG